MLNSFPLMRVASLQEFDLLSTLSHVTCQAPMPALECMLHWLTVEMARDMHGPKLRTQCPC